MLRIDLAEIIRTPGMRHVYDIHEPPFTDDDVEYIAPITGRITVTNTETMLLVRGPIKTTIALECGRCLGPVRAPIEADIEEEFDLKIAEDTFRRGKSVQVVEAEIERVFDDKVLMLDVLIRQAALLAAPLLPLCREECPGITPRASGEPDEKDLKNSPFRELSKLLDH